MQIVLHIDSSARGTGNDNIAYNSISRELAQTFMTEWLSQAPDTRVIYRDVAKEPPLQVDHNWISAAFAAEEQRTEEQKKALLLSDKLIEELAAADVIVMSAPYYNYGMPTQLKAWFDQVIRVGATISFDLARGDFPLRPIMSGKTLVLLTSAGEFGFGVGGVRETWNHLGPHVELLGRKFLGVETYHEIGAEYQEFGDERHTKSIADAHEQSRLLAKTLAE